MIETSDYQLPPEAIYLHYRTFPTENPFVIRNRVLGEMEQPKVEGESGQRLAADSSLVNYAYRTPHYLLGSTLQNPTLSYAGISKQNRACGMLFEDWKDQEICSVHAVVEHGSGGRPQHPFWSVQHENVLLLQRIAPHKLRGSYSTGTIGIGFTGKALKKIEKDGWVFASNGKAFVGVKFLDGAYRWDSNGEVATPENFDPAKDQSRILLHAGDVASDGSFETFQSTVLANELMLTADKVDYRWGKSGNHLEMNLYNPRALDSFSVPWINGKPLDLHPANVYESPYLNGAFGNTRFTLSVGNSSRVLDFND